MARRPAIAACSMERCKRVFTVRGLVGLKDYALVDADLGLRTGTVGYLGYFTLQGISLREAADT